MPCTILLEMITYDPNNVDEEFSLSSLFSDDGNTRKEKRGHSVLPAFLYEPHWYRDLSHSDNPILSFGLMDIRSGSILCRTEEDYEQAMREKYMQAICHECSYCPFLHCTQNYGGDWDSYCHLFSADLDELSSLQDGEFDDRCMAYGYAFGELSTKAGHKNNRYRGRKHRKNIRRALKGVYGVHQRLKKFERRMSRIYYVPVSGNRRDVERALTQSLKQGAEQLVALYRKKNKLRLSGPSEI